MRRRTASIALLAATSEYRAHHKIESNLTLGELRNSVVVIGEADPPYLL
jgi:hypothetical protein